MAGLGMPFEVQDEKLSAGRGEEFSAARIRERQEQSLFGLDDDYQLPMSHRADDALDTAGICMASVDTAIAPDNRGYQMMQRMGWGGRGLGRNEDGLAEPIKGGVEAGLRLGVGKAEEDSHYTAAENVVRKRLEVEVQANEDAARTARREMAVEQQLRIQEDTATAKRNLYCETCHKQYKTAAELDTHLSSYDHHHKKRLIEMKAMNAERTKGERTRKERKRQEKEAAKLQEQIERAHQARLAADAPAASPQPSPLGQPPLPPLPPEDDGAPPPPPPPLPPHMPDVPCHPLSVPPAPAAHAQPRAPASVPPGRWNGQGQAHAPAAAAMTGAGWQGSAGDAAAQPTPPPPPMAFSFGAPRSGGAAPAPAAKPAGGFSMSARKAALKPAVAGFGLDSDEET